MIDRYINLKDTLTFEELEYDLIDSWDDLPFVNEWTTKQVKELYDEYYVIPKTGHKEIIIRHGHWINAYPEIEPNPMFMYGICSVCGFKQSISDKLKFCPECGSMMDELMEK